MLTIGSRFVGPPDRGHGGYAAALLARYTAVPVMVRLRAPVPLETELEVVWSDGNPRLVDGDVVVATSEPYTGKLTLREPVSLAAAEDARGRCVGTEGLHLAPTCFSCGLGPQSFRVHAGPVTGSDLFASPWTPPPWTGPEGEVEEAFVWAAMDCAAGWKVATDEVGKTAVTGEITARVLAPIRPERLYAVVAWAGPWAGRKRSAGSAIFGEGGTPLAASESLWISIER